MLLNFASIEMAKYHIVPDRIDIQIYPTICRQTFFFLIFIAVVVEVVVLLLSILLVLVVVVVATIS